MDETLSALLIGEYRNEKDRLLLYEIFRNSGWRLFQAPSRRKALQCLERHPVHVVISECDHPRWNWRTVLRDLRRFACPPQLIVTSDRADGSLWAEAFNIGAYDVLAQPLVRDEAERVIAGARRRFATAPAGAY